MRSLDGRAGSRRTARPTVTGGRRRNAAERRPSPVGSGPHLGREVRAGQCAPGPLTGASVSRYQAPAGGRFRTARRAVALVCSAPGRPSRVPRSRLRRGTGRGGGLTDCPRESRTETARYAPHGIAAIGAPRRGARSEASLSRIPAGRTPGRSASLGGGSPVSDSRTLPSRRLPLRTPRPGPCAWPTGPDAAACFRAGPSPASPAPERTAWVLGRATGRTPARPPPDPRRAVRMVDLARGARPPANGSGA